MIGQLGSEIAEHCRRGDDDQLFILLLVYRLCQNVGQFCCELEFEVPVWVRVRLDGRAAGTDGSKASTLPIAHEIMGRRVILLVVLTRNGLQTGRRPAVFEDCVDIAPCVAVEHGIYTWGACQCGGGRSDTSR